MEQTANHGLNPLARDFGPEEDTGEAPVAHGEPGDVDLDEWLTKNEISGVAVCGIQTNMCCETTARMASDLGYEMIFVIDATHTFDIATSTRQVHMAREISRFTALTLEADFGTIMRTSELVDSA